MAILDSEPFQTWITAFDRWEQAERRCEAAAKIGHQPLVEYLRMQREQAAYDYNNAIRALKDVQRLG